MHINSKDLRFAELVIGAEAQKLVLRGMISREDREDVKSELLAQLLGVWTQYDPARGPHDAYINHVVNTRIVSLVRARRAAKRAAATEPLEERDVGRDARVGDGPDQLCVIDLSIDLAALMARLRPADRELCESLQRDALNFISKNTGVPRRTLRDGLERIKRVFRDAGLDEYI